MFFLAVFYVFYACLKKCFYESVINMYFTFFYLQINVFNIYALDRVGQRNVNIPE